MSKAEATRQESQSSENSVENLGYYMFLHSIEKVFSKATKMKKIPVLGQNQ